MNNLKFAIVVVGFGVSDGAKIQETVATLHAVDKENKIVSSPCYMHGTSIEAITRGAENIIKALFDMMK